MAFAPIALTIPEYDRNLYKNWWLKAYEQGTTTPLNMATNATGATTLIKCPLDTQGFPITSAIGPRFIPFINGDYDLWLFPTAAEADANDTIDAIQFADNLNADPFATGFDANTALSIADLRLQSGALNQVVNVLSYYTPNFALVNPYDGGGGDFAWDATSADFDNGGTVIKATATTTGRWKRVIVNNLKGLNIRWFGANPLIANNTTSIQDAIDTGKTDALSCYAPAGKYDHSGQIQFWRETPFTGDGVNVTELHYTGSGTAWVIGDAAYRATANGNNIRGWEFGNLKLTGTIAAANGAYFSNIHADTFLPLDISGFTKVGATALALSGNSNWILGETDPFPTITGAFYNTFRNLYVYGNYNGVSMGGVADHGQFNSNTFLGGAIRWNVNNVKFLSCNHNRLRSLSLEAGNGGAGTTEYGVIHAADDAEGTPVTVLTNVTSVSTTATVTSASHGMLENYKVRIAGADQAEYNGDYQVINVSTNAFDYIFAGSATSPATGTITFDRMKGSNGNIIDDCRFEGAYTQKPWDIQPGTVNAVFDKNYYGAYYGTNDPTNVLYAADKGSNSFIHEYRLALGNIAIWAGKRLLAEEIGIKYNSEIRIKSADGTTLAVIDDAAKTFDFRHSAGALSLLKLFENGSIQARVAATKDIEIKDSAGNNIAVAGETFGYGGFRINSKLYVPFGSTANRPTVGLTGAHYWDSTLSKPIWWNGTAWEDATGATV